MCCEVRISGVDGAEGPETILQEVCGGSTIWSYSSAAFHILYDDQGSRWRLVKSSGCVGFDRQWWRHLLSWESPVALADNPVPAGLWAAVGSHNPVRVDATALVRCVRVSRRMFSAFLCCHRFAKVGGVERYAVCEGVEAFLADSEDFRHAILHLLVARCRAAAEPFRSHSLQRAFCCLLWASWAPWSPKETEGDRCGF